MLSPESLWLEFTTNQETFPDLKFVTDPDNRRQFQHPVSFDVEVRNLNAGHIARKWAVVVVVDWAENFDGIDQRKLTREHPIRR
jgi:hypothetical protein